MADTFYCKRQNTEMEQNHCIVRQSASRHFDNGCGGCSQAEEIAMRKKMDMTGLTCKTCGEDAEKVKLFIHKRGQCKQCVDREKRSRSKQEAATPEKEKKATPKPVKPKSEKAVEPATSVVLGTITVNFSHYPELYKRIVDQAEEEVRTPELQALFLLKQAVGNLPEIIE